MDVQVSAQGSKSEEQYKRLMSHADELERITDKRSSFKGDRLPLYIEVAKVRIYALRNFRK